MSASREFQKKISWRAKSDFSDAKQKLLLAREFFNKTEPQASVVYISRLFSNVRSVLTLCNTPPRLLHLLYDIEIMCGKTIKHAFSMFYTLIKHKLLINQDNS